MGNGKENGRYYLGFKDEAFRPCGHSSRLGLGDL